MTIETAKADHDEMMIANVMKATGLSKEQAKRLLLLDDDHLDSLCDAALSDASEPTKNAGPL